VRDMSNNLPNISPTMVKGWN